MKKTLLLLVGITLFSCQKKTKVDNQLTETAAENVLSTESDSKLQFNMANTTLKWTAYKTPEKLGVDGSFKTIQVGNTNKGETPEQILEGATFDILNSSVTTNDVSRDATIAKFFFGQLMGENIKGSFGKFENGKVSVEIEMNGQKIAKEFKYQTEDSKITLNGEIDVLSDFKAEKGFNSLHKECEQLHLGKTWTDVSIEIVSDFKSN